MSALARAPLARTVPCVNQPLSIIHTIVVHCSDSRNGRPTPTSEIDEWHKARGFRRSSIDRRKFNSTLGFIGYHFVIGVDGTVSPGRDLTEVGVHAKGHNRGSIAICLVGKDKFSLPQWNSLRSKVVALQVVIAAARDGKQARIVGHCDLTDEKPCPCFDVQAWIDGGSNPLQEHLL